MKYTVTWDNYWLSGSQTITKLSRIEKRDDESLKQCLEREGLYDLAVYILEGWPTLKGGDE